MRTAVGLLTLLAALAVTSGAQGHDTKYIYGGYGSTSATYATGVWMSDAGAQTVTHLTPGELMYYSRNGIKMDRDNKNIVFTAYGTTSTTYTLKNGIYRLDPSTKTFTTLTTATYGPRALIVNQDGDYVVNLYSTSPTSYDMMKLDQAGNLTPILSSLQTNNATLYGLGRNMDTGNYLVNLYKANTFYYCVLDVAEDGTYTTFAGGSVSTTYGWYGYYSRIEQNHDTGDIEGHYNRVLYQLKAGSGGPRTTLWQLGLPGGMTMRYGSVWDNQSEPNPQIIASGYTLNKIGTTTHYTHTVFRIDMKPPYFVTATDCDPNGTSGFTRNYAYSFDFYRGRHIQPIKVGPQKWQLSFSCPRFAGRNYVAAVSLAGYRPAVPLVDGRRIHLVPDTFTFLSIAGLLSPYFYGGGGTLDAQGAAVGSLDLSSLGKLDIPIWIALVVLDGAAPLGIAYLPDTYVMRV